MFVHSLDPVLFSLGPLDVRWYGLVYALGFLFAYWYLGKKADEGRIGLTRKQTDDFVLWLIILSIVCARLTYVLVYNPAYYLDNPWKILAVWEGGLSFHGGLLGAAIAGLWYQRRHNITFYTLADLLVAPFALTLVFGRLANFINGELPGRPSSAPWCVVFPGYEECRHPSQLYEALKNLVVFGLLMAAQRVDWIKERLRPGALFWSFVLLYGLGRFLTDFWRAPDPTDPVLGGLLIGQWLSLAMAVLGAAFLARTYGRARTRA